MKKIKILEVLPCLTQSNGVAAYISNYFKFAKNKEKFDIYFLVFAKSICDRHDEILKNGGKIIEMYPSKNIFQYIQKLKKLFKEGSFDIIHCHAPNFGAIVMPIAKKYGIKVRITHSHVNKSGETFIKNIRNYVMSLVCVYFSNYYFACSTSAAEMLFKNKEYIVINNAIDLEKFKFSNKKRKELRKKLNIDNKFVIGEFGRLCSQKNQFFILKIFNEYLNKNQNSILLLAGDGPLETSLKMKVEEMGLSNKVIFLGSVNNIYDYYNVLDFFVLPSTYEGLGIVLIEAQANGLHCLASNKVIPPEAKVSKLLEFVSLDKSPKEWSNKIIECERVNIIKEIEENGFDIKQESNKLFELYLNLYEGEN